ncbi:MAG: ATP-dependent DNA helicase RecQ [Bacteroidales bacterium]|nr:ATP-dependent DNA helicase RecQ [Bacteroidales bacterium]
MPFKEILHKFWGYSAFRPMQESIIQSVYDGKDTLAILPTGGGKSITFQVPALAMDGICIVVSPLIALMQDQVQNLVKRGIKALFLHSGLSKNEIEISLNNAIFGGYKFLYLSPERVGTDLFQHRAKDMKINLVAIDEAHCISQWGYDFRPSYLNLGFFKDNFGDVPVLALTATATPAVAKDICEKLALEKPVVVKSAVERANLYFFVKHTEDKKQGLKDYLSKPRGSGIVYVRNRKSTREVAEFLSANGIAADFYHAGLGHDTRKQKQQAWTQGKNTIVVATNAFGMGIDKPDVRFVVHLDIPQSLEEYYQEAGRAGRDNKNGPWAINAY